MAPKLPSTGNFGKLSFEASAIKQGVISRPLNSFGCLVPSTGHCSSGNRNLCLCLPCCPILQEELESYPLDAIIRCDTVMPRGRSRSLLLLVCQEPERAQPDVHFFQGLLLGVSGLLSRWPFLQEVQRRGFLVWGGACGKKGMA